MNFRTALRKMLLSKLHTGREPQGSHSPRLQEEEP